MTRSRTLSQGMELNPCGSMAYRAFKRQKFSRGDTQTQFWRISLSP